MLRLLLASAVTELARSRSKPIAIGVVPTTIGVEKFTVALIGPEIVVCTTVFVVGFIYITVAEPSVIVALVYVPCGMETIASGCIVPIRCIISIGVALDTALTLPLLPFSVIEVMFIEKASIQSAGVSPMFTCTAVLAAELVLVLVAALPPLPHAVNIPARAIERTTAIALRHTFRCWIARHMPVVSIFVAPS